MSEKKKGFSIYVVGDGGTLYTHIKFDLNDLKRSEISALLLELELFKEKLLFLAKRQGHSMTRFEDGEKKSN